MKIHEYQGKEVFKSFSIPTPRGYLIKDINSAEKIIKKAHDEFKSDKAVIKAQIHAGGRGKGGGVKVANGLESALKYVKEMHGMQLVTHQTGSSGQKVRKVYIEEASEIKK